MKVYMDNGASTKVDDAVFEEMKPFFTEKYGNASSLHGFGQEAKEAMENAREAVAKKINALPEEIIFTSGGTESNNFAIKGIAYANKDKGNHIITTKIEHDCILESCRSLEKEGFKVTYLDVDKDGLLNLQDLKEAITKETILVSIIHGNNEIGTVQDLEDIGRICKEEGVHFHSDACQSFTKEDIDVKRQDISLLTINSHKIHGPKGVGALYIKKGVKIYPMMLGGGHERRLRSGTENVSGIVGFSKAVDIAKKEYVQEMVKLRDKLVERVLKEIPYTRLNGHKTKRLCNNINISFEFIEGESLMMMLDDKGISVSTGSACSSKSLDPSHVLLAIGLDHGTAHGSLRFTISKYTTIQEIGYVVESLKEAVSKLRKMSPLYRGE